MFAFKTRYKMSCSGCSSRGYVSFEDDNIIVKDGCNKLNAYDWLNDLPNSMNDSDIVEIRFKNTRKEFFRNTNQIPLVRGEIVAVESQYGHDVGIISLTGKLAEKQLRLRGYSNNSTIKKIYRKATSSDIIKWKEAQQLDTPTMLKSRKIIQDLKLNMKLSDVEYQGDKSKAIFYYIAEQRVDFRQLIKVLAETFRIKVEMKQIGARQEAALVGGIGSCGRELCCSTWKTNFTTVPTNAARFQDLSSNAQKLAGQCGKLKCCLMYEIDNYLEAWEQFPKELLELDTEKGTYYPFKVDVLKKQVFYSMNKHSAMGITAIGTKRIKEIIDINKHGKKPKDLKENNSDFDSQPAFTSSSENDRIDRFTSKKVNRRNKPRRKQKGDIRKTSVKKSDR